MDFAYFSTENSLNLLPTSRGPISELKTQFAFDPWKVCLGKPNDPAWHDHIMFKNGEFFLESVRVEHEQAATALKA